MTRSKLLEQIKVVTDGTSAFAKIPLKLSFSLQRGQTKNFRLATQPMALTKIS